MTKLSLLLTFLFSLNCFSNLLMECTSENISEHRVTLYETQNTETLMAKFFDNDSLLEMDCLKSKGLIECYGEDLNRTVNFLMELPRFKVSQAVMDENWKTDNEFNPILYKCISEEVL